MRHDVIIIICPIILIIICSLLFYRKMSHELHSIYKISLCQTFISVCILTQKIKAVIPEFISQTETFYNNCSIDWY